MRWLLLLALSGCVQSTDIETCYGELVVDPYERRAAVIDSIKKAWAPRNVYVYPDSVSVLIEGHPEVCD